MEATYQTLEELEEHFHKLQLADQNNFQDRLDTLQVIVRVSRTQCMVFVSA